MYQLPKCIKTTLLFAGLGAVAVTTLIASAASSHRHGTDILHFFARTPLTGDGTITNATGRVEADQNQQGNANNQKLEITVKNLYTNAPFQLLALVNDDTNYTQVAEFLTDSKGRAVIAYRKVGSSHGHGNLGHGKSPLPLVLDPVSHLREVAIAMNSTQVVLQADLTVPDKLEYLIKRDLSANGVDALLRLHSNLKQTQFRLTALGLNRTNVYLLVLNGGIVQTNTTDNKGRLDIRALLEKPVDILDVRTLGLWDSSSNVVLSTTLP